MTDRVLVIGPNVARIGIGVNDVDIRLVARGAQGEPEVIGIACSRELLEEAMCEVVFVVAPVALPFSEPVSVVEEPVLTLGASQVHMLLVAAGDEFIPKLKLYAFRSRDVAKGAGRCIPTCRDDSHQRRLDFREQLLAGNLAGEVDGEALGRRHAPLEAVVAGDKGELQVIGQIVAEGRAGQFGEQSDTDAVFPRGESLGPACQKSRTATPMPDPLVASQLPRFCPPGLVCPSMVQVLSRSLD